METKAVDLFAGPGGWDVASRALGMDVTGIEFDHAACETRRAAGFQTIEDDVTHYGPADFPDATTLIASPPCQTFSMAGKGSGRAALDTVLTVLVEMVGGRRVQPDDFADPRTALVLEPLRWILDAHKAGRPFRAVALEQVPTVLPVWQSYGAVMRELGYSVATGNLHAEQYGVPQTRKRAVLIASLDREAVLPRATHSRFHTRDKTRLDPGMLPWVSMAEALGWGMDARPFFTVATAGGARGGADEQVGGSGARRALYAERDAGRWQIASSTRPNGATRPTRDPSPTLAFGHDSASWVWTPEGMSTAEVVEWKAEQNWAFERPATTIVGSFRPEIVAAPGYRVSVEDGSRQNAPGSVRVTVEEASALQSFPPGFPWQGSKTKQYQQIGNAIPPKLALAVLRTLL